MKNEIMVKIEYRPCYVNEKKAIFHRWSEKADVILEREYFKDLINCTLGIVELEDGTIQEVEPRSIRFCDNHINEYCFGVNEN